MDSIPQLFQQLKYIEENIRIFYGDRLILPTLNRMLANRRKMIKRIQRRQIKEFDHG
jgi:hypothetical protein